jgi:uncharacterized protein
MAERIFLYIYLTLFVAVPLQADEDKIVLPPKNVYRPAISIIIDDLGERFDSGLKAIKLSGQVTLAFLPYTPYAAKLAALSHAVDKEVMLHMPMESIYHNRMGKGGLTADMHQKEFVKAIEDALASVPYVAGINNHMGSLLTQQHEHMLWLMQEINNHGNLFFVDSRTIVGSVAQKVAMENHTPNLRRNIFLDTDRHPDAIRSEYLSLINIAQQDGTALAIGHPYPQTLAFLQEALPEVEKYGVELVSVSTLIARKNYLDKLRATTHMVAIRPATSDTMEAGNLLSGHSHQAVTQ